jgi:hypothetical protein
LPAFPAIVPARSTRNAPSDGGYRVLPAPPIAVRTMVTEALVLLMSIS